MRTLPEVERAAQAGDPEAQELLSTVFHETGRLDQAVYWLGQAAKAGLPSAHAKLGLWQLVGNGVAQDPANGAERILAAARAGDLFGLNLASVIDAGGIGVPVNVSRGLEWAAGAAKLGDGRAACQLALLIGLEGAQGALGRNVLSYAAACGFEAARRFARVAPAPPQIDWAACLRAIDLTAWRADPQRDPQRADPRIEVIHDLIPRWACDYVAALAAPALRRGKVLAASGLEQVDDMRSNRVMSFGLADSDVVLELINHRLAAAAQTPIENAEALGVLNYQVGERYAPHVDYIPPTPENAAQLQARGQRVRTVLIYLNDGFDGGATEFPRLGLAFKPAAGSALLFDSVTAGGEIAPMTLHTGAPPARGEKWVISKWFRNRPLRPGPA